MTTVDPWQDILLRRLADKGLFPELGVTLNQCLEALDVPLERRNRTEGGRFHAIVRHLKWDRRQVLDDNGTRVWKYFASTEAPPPIPVVEPEPPSRDYLQGCADRDKEWRAWWVQITTESGMSRPDRIAVERHSPPPDRKAGS